MNNQKCVCGCVDVTDHGPCKFPVRGSSCVYCDHALSCHSKKKWKKEKSIVSDYSSKQRFAILKTTARGYRW